MNLFRIEAASNDMVCTVVDEAAKIYASVLYARNTGLRGVGRGGFDHIFFEKLYRTGASLVYTRAYFVLLPNHLQRKEGVYNSSAADTSIQKWRRSARPEERTCLTSNDPRFGPL